MLWPIKSEQSRIRIVGVGGNVSNPGGTISTNEDDVKNIAGAASTSWDLKDPSKRTIMTVGSVHSSSSNFNGGTLCTTSSPVDSDSTNVITYRSSGQGEASFNALCLCVDTLVTSRVMKNLVTGQKRQGGAVVVGRISSSGSVTYGKGDFSCSKTATGTYAITFRRKNFGRIPLCVVQPRIAVSTDAIGSRIDSLTINGCTIYTAYADAPSANALVDAEFDILLYGFGTMDDYGRARSPLSSTKRTGRIEAHRIETQTHAFGSSVGSLVASGSGQYALTHINKYGYSPHVFFTGNTNRAINALTSSTSSITTFYSRAIDSGAGADASQLNALVIGFDDSSDY